MKSFFLTREEVDMVYAETSRYAWKMGHKRPVLKPNMVHDNIHFLVLHLIRGRNIYKHFKPKKPDQYLISKLSGEHTDLRPYHSLHLAACQYSWLVPKERIPGERSWSSAMTKLKDMEYILSHFNGLIGYSELVRLRPYILKLKRQYDEEYEKYYSYYKG